MSCYELPLGESTKLRISNLHFARFDELLGWLFETHSRVVKASNAENQIIQKFVRINVRAPDEVSVPLQDGRLVRFDVHI
jgi:ribosomal protein S10